MAECPSSFWHLPVSKCNFLRTLKIQTNKKSLTANAAKQIRSVKADKHLTDHASKSHWETFNINYFNSLCIKVNGVAVIFLKVRFIAFGFVDIQLLLKMKHVEMSLTLMVYNRVQPG